MSSSSPATTTESSSHMGISKTAQDALTCKLSADLTYGSIYHTFFNNTTKVLGKDIILHDYYQNYANVVVKKQNPLLNRFYFLRQQIIHYNFAKLLKTLPLSSNSHCNDLQVLILGGGYDISFEFYELPKYHLHYFVVDFPEVLERREMYHSQRKRYPSKTIQYIAGDLLHCRTLLRQLEEAGINYSQPTIVIFECVLSYLPKDKVQNIFQLFSSLFTSISLLEYDPLFGVEERCRSADQGDFFHQTFSSFSQNDAPLLSHSSTITQLMTIHYQNGWQHLLALSLDQSLQYHQLAGIIDPFIQQSLESFDEFSSIHLLLGSYHVTVASNNTNWFRAFTSYTEGASLHHELTWLRLKIAEEKLSALESFRSLNRSSRDGNDFVIQAGCKDDIPQLTELYLRVFDKYAKLNKSIQKYVKNATKDFNHLKSEDNHFIKFWVCRKGKEGEIIGCVGLKIIQKKAESQPHYEVCNFSVEENYRRKGIGRLLINEVIKFCRDNSQKQLELTVVNQLEEAREFYKRMGFQLVEERMIDSQCILHHLILDL